MRYTLAISAIFAAAGLVSAELKVTQPTASHWWVAQSLNTLAWDGSDPSQFSVFISNPDQNVLTSILALTSVTYAYDKSKTINPGNITPATGYTILLTNPLNSSDVYATSQTFEIKAVGSEYPPQTSVPTAAASDSSSSGAAQSGSGTATSSSAEASSTGGNSAAFRRSSISAGGVVVVAAGLVAGAALL
ncbi:hypothetical protein I316_01398 [Kwoniella heveanensis BCC8398]|uniref:Yeast cell wall synthesis Kre9/Knh1-like N-terminal domain-containing protein n=1 Tax=Kwoniella heveanensis BCC8398 TaxID=1296120 RepID=A0A1B9H0K0_9TREE|nr:hypothetical protein I316_01398 [Kwoniella heveanensis BCC8398]